MPHFTLFQRLLWKPQKKSSSVDSMPFGDVSLRVSFVFSPVSLSLRYESAGAVSAGSLHAKMPFHLTLTSAFIPDSHYNVPELMGPSTTTPRVPVTLSPWLQGEILATDSDLAMWTKSNLFFEVWPYLQPGWKTFHSSYWSWNLCHSMSGMPHFIGSDMHI